MALADVDAPSLLATATTTAIADVDAGAAIGGLLFLGVFGYLVVSGVLPLLLLLGGDPDKKEEEGFVADNEWIKSAALAVTPSAWKKAYQGDDKPDDEAEKTLLDLPAWQGEEARELVEPEAVRVLEKLQYAEIEVPSVGPVGTSFVSLQPEKPADAPPLMMIHGFDSSVLEFRYVIDELLAAGIRVEAMEWWTGGFTDRTPFTQKLKADESATPWDLIREHQYAFYKRQLGGQKAIVLGASLGGAVAMDFAKEHPECVEALVLMDAGGESYAQPPPFLTSLCADPVTNLFQWRANNGLLPSPHVWNKFKDWNPALRAYLNSGGYQNKVNPELIRTLPQPAYVLWGEADDVLPVSDAYKYEKDLPNCAGVTLVPEGQHAPALENPPFVAKAVTDYVLKVGQQLKEGELQAAK